MPLTYTCTLDSSCRKTFTNIPDWQAHHKTSHLSKVAYWFCQERLSTTPGEIAPCNRGFYDKAEHDAHFQKEHRQNRLDMKKPDASPLGPMVGERYYCGFCRDIYAVQGLKAVGPSEWYEGYFRHMQGHFEGRNAMKKIWKIGDWKWLPIFDVEDKDPFAIPVKTSLEEIRESSVDLVEPELQLI